MRPHGPAGTLLVSAFLLVSAAGTVPLRAAGAAERRVIPNELGLAWPHEPVYFDFDPARRPDLGVVEFAGETRPVQVETVEEDGKRVARAWFIASILVAEKYDERRKRTYRGKPPKSLEVVFRAGSAEPGIRVSKERGFTVVDNGVYEFRVRDYRHRFRRPRPLAEIPHWIGGMRVKGSDAWDGRAWFDGSAVVRGAKVEVLNEGPVFVDLRITYEFMEDAPGASPRDGGPTCRAVPLKAGKQTHRWKPNRIPYETVPKLERHLEVLVRFVAGDPWIDVNERYHLPRDEGLKPWGIHQQWIHWGRPPADLPGAFAMPRGEHMPVDTVTWVRWFEYDTFGGNVDQRYVPARPRPAQKGRPFAQLRPRWNQMGGGAQDFFLTSGGERKYDRETKEHVAPPGHSPENPAVGVVAAYASKWVGPYAQTIAAYALDGERGQCRFPMTDGERSGLHYGQRSYGLCVGPRRMFTSINDVVRRHTDWTLVAQIHKYVLKWERDPAKAGPHALVTRERLAELKREYESGRDTPVARILKESAAELEELRARKKDLDERCKAADRRRKSKEASDEEKEAARREYDRLRAEIRKLDGRLGSSDMKILGLVTKGETQNVRTRTAELWLQRRYQDDFLNPTQRTTRDIKRYAVADLFAGGKPHGGAGNAAMGYIHTDLDQWPGWHHGWSPGNPNFHTDKYMAAIYVATAMLDHPHAGEWLEYGLDNFRNDLERVLLPPDGVGYECPGYSGYSLGLQLKLARVFLNCGHGNPVAENPLFKNTGRWHRKLLTPVDPRLGRRHEAPHGDTHRWDSGLGLGFGKLAAFYGDTDRAFAGELMGVYAMLKAAGLKPKERLQTELIDTDVTIPPTRPEDMDWSSEAFHGFGAIMRTGFGTERETFVSVKAGPAHGHYHNDENAFHYYCGMTPVSLDYNCSYHPRGDHACLHNTMTFGKGGVVRHNKRGEPVKALEQAFGTSWPGAFATTDAADVLVAERRSDGLTLYPVDPHDHEFGRRYPSRKVDEIVHRRFVALVKHPPRSRLTDYLVVRDETRSTEPQQVNVHLLARSVELDGDTVRAPGQWDKDIIVHLARASNPRIETREWFYWDEWMVGPEEYAIEEGETQEAWERRMKKFMRRGRADGLPLPGWEPKWQDPRSGESEPWFERIRRTKGRALMPPPHWRGKWLYGECQLWLRIHTSPGTPVLWVLYARARGEPEPTFETIEDGRGVRITLGRGVDELLMATDADGLPGQVVVRSRGRETVLVKPGELPPLGRIRREPLGR